MGTLEEKFTELQGQMESQNTAILAALSTAQSSLDTMAVNSGISAVALGIIATNTGTANDKLTAIFNHSEYHSQRLFAITDTLFPALDTRIASIQDDILRVRKILATVDQYANSDTGQTNTVFGRLDESLLQLASVFDDGTGMLPGNSTYLGGLLGSLFLNIASIQGSANTITSNTSQASQTLTDHTPLLEAIRDCTCDDSGGGGGGGGDCDPILDGVVTAGTNQVVTVLGGPATIWLWALPYEGNVNGEQVAEFGGPICTFGPAVSSVSDGTNEIYDLNGTDCMIGFPAGKFAITVDTSIGDAYATVYWVRTGNRTVQDIGGIYIDQPFSVTPGTYQPEDRFVIRLHTSNPEDVSGITLSLRVCP